ncbi:hypothetical protein N9L68_02985 [bacterium]|nr:hypothetical protein [bacterium]
MKTLGIFAHAVAPTIDSLAGTAASRHTRKLADDYQIRRSKVMGVHHEGQSVGNHHGGYQTESIITWSTTNDHA